MRALFAIFVTGTVFLTAGFIFFAMNANPECVARLAGQPACGAVNAVEFLSHQLGIMQGASWGITGAAFAAAALLAAILGWSAVISKQSVHGSGFTFVRNATVFAAAPSRRDLQRWMSLHEKRDPAGIH